MDWLEQSKTLRTIVTTIKTLPSACSCVVLMVLMVLRDKQVLITLMAKSGLMEDLHCKFDTEVPRRRGIEAVIEFEFDDTETGEYAMIDCNELDEVGQEDGGSAIKSLMLSSKIS